MEKALSPYTFGPAQYAVNRKCRHCGAPDSAAEYYANRKIRGLKQAEEARAKAKHEIDFAKATSEFAIMAAQIAAIRKLRRK